MTLSDNSLIADLIALRRSIKEENDCKPKNEPETKLSNATIFVRAFKDNTKCFSDGNAVFVYNGCIYKEYQDEELFQLIETDFTMFNGKWSMYYFNEISKQMKHSYFIPYEERVKNRPDYLIPFMNCLFNMRTKKTEIFSDKYLFTEQLPYDYVLTNPPLFNYALCTTLPLLEDRDKLLAFFQESMNTGIRYQKALLLTGVGANGKTSLLECIMELYGRRATTLKRSRLKEEGGIIDIRGKTMVVMSEVGGGRMSIEEMDLLKSIITDKFQSGRKKYGKEVKFQNTWIFFFTSNPPLPKLAQLFDEAFFRRFDMIEFNQQFKGNDIDYYLYDDIIKHEADQVLSYIVRYIPTYDFKNDWMDIADKWNLMSDTVKRFVADKCYHDETQTVERDSLYSEYISFCNSMQLTEVSKKWFIQTLERMGYICEKLLDEYVFYNINLGVKIEMINDG